MSSSSTEIFRVCLVCRNVAGRGPVRAGKQKINPSKHRSSGPSVFPAGFHETQGRTACLTPNQHLPLPLHISQDPVPNPRPTGQPTGSSTTKSIVSFHVGLGSLSIVVVVMALPSRTCGQYRELAGSGGQLLKEDRQERGNPARGKAWSADEVHARPPVPEWGKTDPGRKPFHARGLSALVPGAPSHLQLHKRVHRVEERALQPGALDHLRRGTCAGQALDDAGRHSKEVTRAGMQLLPPPRGDVAGSPNEGSSNSVQGTRPPSSLACRTVTVSMPCGGGGRPKFSMMGKAISLGYSSSLFTAIWKQAGLFAGGSASRVAAPARPAPAARSKAAPTVRPAVPRHPHLDGDLDGLRNQRQRQQIGRVGDKHVEVNMRKLLGREGGPRSGRE